MKTILYMAITVNGFIAKNNDSTDFVTNEESVSYVSAVKDAGSLVIGRKTYEILSKQQEFQKFLEAGVKIIAVSKSDFKVYDSNHSVAHSPKEALNLLKDSKEVIVAGGGELNAAFLGEGLIDEIYIDVEPNILGKGIPIFNGGNFEKNLEFLGLKYITKDELQLHYKVK